MVWAGGTQTITHPTQNSLKIVATNFDANAEATGTTEIAAITAALGNSVVPKRFSISVARTAGTDNVVDVALQGSLDGIGWVDICTATTSDSIPYPPLPDEGEPSIEFGAAAFLQYRIYVTDVGNANTLTVTVAMSW